MSTMASNAFMHHQWDKLSGPRRGRKRCPTGAEAGEESPACQVHWPRVGRVIAARDCRAAGWAGCTLAGVGGFSHAAGISPALASGAARRACRFPRSASRISARSPRAGGRGGAGRGVSLLKGDMSPWIVWRANAAGDMSPLEGDVSPLVVWRADGAGDMSPLKGDVSPLAVWRANAAGDMSPQKGDTSPLAVWRATSAGDTSLLKGDMSPAAAGGGFSVDFDAKPFSDPGCGRQRHRRPVGARPAGSSAEPITAHRTPRCAGGGVCRMGLAQRGRLRGAAVGTKARGRRSLRRMVRPHNLSLKTPSEYPLGCHQCLPLKQHPTRCQSEQAW